MAPSLRRDLGFSDPDSVYEALIDAISDLEVEAATRVMAKMILLLANHVGDDAVVREVIAAARAEPTD
jgi:hypothetical protein